MVLNGNRDRGVEDGEKDQGKAVHISIVWDLSPKYIYLGPPQTYGIGISRQRHQARTDEQASPGDSAASPG